MLESPQAYASSYDKEAAFTEEGWKKRLDAPNRIHYAFYENDTIVSVAGAIKIDTEDTWLIVGVYTRPEARGKGYAKVTIQAIMSDLRDRGETRVRLFANVDQAEAVGLYRKLGFEIIETREGILMSDGKMHDNYLMEKEL